MLSLTKVNKHSKTVSELIRMLDLLGHFHRSIPNFSKIASTLLGLLNNLPEKSAKFTIVWNKNIKGALDTLLHLKTNVPLLMYNDSDQPFILYPIASAQGLRCAFNSQENRELRILGLGSRTLVGSESKHHNPKLKFLALKWAIYEHFHDYLCCSSHFDFYTNFNPLVYLKTSCKVNDG